MEPATVPAQVAADVVATPMRTASKRPRDLRLDFFRGLALWFIFLDHVPDNVVSWLTVRNYGFSDATEIFVFISGYAAVIAYGGVLAERGTVVAVARVVRRVWQLYVAHLLLFLAFTVQIAWVSLRTGRQAYLESMNLLGLVDDPARTLIETALLKFRPVNLDVLPLYIVVLASFAAALPLVRRWPWRVLAVSALLYYLARRLGWNFPGYPEGKNWYFDPFTWQLVFYIGAAFAVDGRMGERLRPCAKFLAPAAIAYLLFALLVALSWEFRALAFVVPDWLGRLIYPIDKTTLDPLRLAHFLALAYVVQLAVPADARFLSWRIVRPLRRCGEHSLLVFCIGTFLSFTAHVVLSEVGGSVSAQVAVSAIGIALLAATAGIAGWHKKLQRT
ncbi:MAG: OpgC domain-containing protein [Burkholderiales bacterium]|nr:OpgC domain-containing protein [Burkholderiales bacterium]